MERFVENARDFARLVDQELKAQVRGTGGRYVSTGSAGPSEQERLRAEAIAEARAMRAEADAARGPSVEQKVAKLASDLHAKYPHTQFVFTGMSLKTAQRVSDHVSMLYEKYPQAAQTIPYLGMGIKFFAGGTAQHRNNTFAAVQWGKGDVASSPMYLNPKFFNGNAQRGDAASAANEKTGWSPPGATTIEANLTHEFGHVVYNYLEKAGAGARHGESTVAKVFHSFLESHFELGREVSGYARSSSAEGTRQTGKSEQFAEAFCSLHYTPVSKQQAYTKQLAVFLEQVLPGGSSANWLTKQEDKAQVRGAGGRYVSGGGKVSSPSISGPGAAMAGDMAKIKEAIQAGGMQLHGNGVNTGYKLAANGRTYFVKSTSADEAVSEIAASHLAASTGAQHLVAPLEHFAAHGETYLVTPFVEGKTLLELGSNNMREAFGHMGVHDQATAILHEYISGDQDRNSQNYLYNQQTKKLTMIDFGGALWRDTAAMRRSRLYTLSFKDIATRQATVIPKDVLSHLVVHQQAMLTHAKADGVSVDGLSGLRKRLQVIQSLHGMANPTFGDLEKLAGVE